MASSSTLDEGVKSDQPVSVEARYRGAPVGSFYPEIDGYYVLALPGLNGYVTEGFLRDMADQLRDLNQEWHAQVCADAGQKTPGNGGDP